MKAVPLTGIAKRVYDDIVALEPEAAVEYARMVVLGGLHHDLEVHQDLIQKRVDGIISKRAERLKQVVTRSYVSKRMGGEDVERLVAVAEQISKAGFGNLSVEDRRRLAALQDRDRSGRFKSMNKKIVYNDRAQPYPGRFARSMGIPKPDGLGSRNLAQYQQAWTQVNDMLAQFSDAPVGSTQLSLVYSQGKNGRITRETHEFVPGQKVSDEVLDPKRFNGDADKRLLEAQVIVDGGLDTQGAAFNLIGGLAGPAAGGMAARSQKRVLDSEGNPTEVYEGERNLGSFADDWARWEDGEATSPSARIFRRIGLGSKLLSDIGGPNVPMPAQVALETANQVSRYGPEAQKVIGPHADRAAYRYRGVERKPDAQLQQSINNAKSMADRDGKTGSEWRNALIYGWTELLARRPGQAPRTQRRESPLVEYFANRVPDPDLIHLQRKSGVIPPSEGIIIDRNGKVITQAVGYGDDWYLPFNLKTLSKLKGGDYIRTRTFGGPTTEDIYTGLMSGARSLTVVSHNGVYTIEFDESFRGSRRYSDKAARMVKRYGHLLDAVKSRQVRLTDIPPERDEELKRLAAQEHDPRDRSERPDYERKLKELREDERQDPLLSQAQVETLAEEFLNDKAGHLQTQDGYAENWAALANKYVADITATKNTQLEALYPDLDLTGERAKIKVEATNAVRNPMTAIVTLGYGEEFERKLEEAQAEEKARRSPLDLDGEGYSKSMQALQQQFPYYIANVSYRPKRRGGLDHGYVKPKFNRPEDALAGYYDETITGSGKRGADETRFQNHGVNVAAAKDRMKGKKAVPVEDAASATRDETGDSRESRGPKITQEERLAAFQKVYDQIAEATNYSVHGRGKGGPIGVGADRPPELAPFKDRGWESWMDEFLTDFDKASTKFLAAVEPIRTQKMVDVDENDLLAARNPERAAKGVDWNIGRAAVNAALTFDFGIEANKSAQHYDSKIERLAQQLGVSPDASDDELQDIIRKEYDLYKMAERHRTSTKHFEQRAKAAAQIKALRRAKTKSEEWHTEQERIADERRLAAAPNVGMANRNDLPELLRSVFDNGDHNVLPGETVE